MLCIFRQSTAFVTYDIYRKSNDSNFVYLSVSIFYFMLFQDFNWERWIGWSPIHWFAHFIYRSHILSVNKKQSCEIKDRWGLSRRSHKEACAASLEIKRPAGSPSTFVRPRTTEDCFIPFDKKIQRSKAPGSLLKATVSGIKDRCPYREIILANGTIRSRFVDWWWLDSFTNGGHEPGCPASQ